MHTNINPTTCEFEGFTYLEFEGAFFKGCRRCGGTGHYSFNGFDSNCYLCGNTSAKLGDPLESREAAEKWCHERALRLAQRDRKREQERLKLVALMEGNQEHLKAEAPDVYEFLMAFDLETDKHSFLRNMAEVLRYVGPSKPFTPNMIEATRKAMASLVAKQAEQEAHPVPEGRVVITGEIVGTKVVEGDYGTWDPEYPWFHEAKGRRVTFTATIQASKDDKSFGFGSRPTKGSWI